MNINLIKNTVSLFILVAATCVANAQELIKWGAPFLTTTNYSTFKPIGTKDKNTSFVEQSFNALGPTNTYITEFDEACNYLTRKEIKVIVKGEKVNRLSVLPTSSGYIAFNMSSEKLKSGKGYVVYATLLNNNFEQLKQARIYEIEGRKRESDIYDHGDPAFGVSASDDNKHFLLCMRPEMKRDDKEILMYEMISENLDILWSKKFTLPMKHSATEIIQKEGDIMADIIDPHKVIVYGSYETAFAHCYDASTGFERTIDTKAEFLHKREQHEKSFELLFLKPNKKQIPETISRYKINGQDFDTVEISSISLTQQQLDDLVDNRYHNIEKAYGMGYGYNGRNTTDIIAKKNGGYYIIFENAFQYPKSNTPNRYTSNNEILYMLSLNISVISINSEGAVEWINKVSKEQHLSSNSRLSIGYVAVETPEGLSVLYYDNPDNINSTTLIKGKEKEQVIGLAKFDSKGAVTRSVYGSTDLSDGLEFYPNYDKMNLFTDTNFFTVHKGKTWRIGKFSVN